MEVETAMNMMKATKMELEMVDEKEEREAVKMELNKMKAVKLALKMEVWKMKTEKDALKMELEKVKAEKNARWEKWEVDMEVKDERDKVMTEFLEADRQRGPGSAELEQEKEKNRQAVGLFKAKCELEVLERAGWRRERAEWERNRMEWQREKMGMVAQLNKQNRSKHTPERIRKSS